MPKHNHKPKNDYTVTSSTIVQTAVQQARYSTIPVPTKCPTQITKLLYPENAYNASHSWYHLANNNPKFTL
jgi:hypothetical protein